MQMPKAWLPSPMYLDACLSYSDSGQSYIAQMEWTRHEICIYLLYVCYNSENKQQQQQPQLQSFYAIELKDKITVLYMVVMTDWCGYFQCILCNWCTYAGDVIVNMCCSRTIPNTFWVDIKQGNSHTRSYSVPSGDLCHAHPSWCNTIHKVFSHAEIKLDRCYFCADSEF